MTDLKEYINTKEGLISYRPKYNVPNKKVYFFNRMPRSAGASIKELLLILSHRQKFNLEIIDKSTHLMNKNVEVADFLHGKYKKLQKATIPTVVLQNHFYINFTAIETLSNGLPNTIKKPTWISMVRDPIDKFISNYYSCRFGTVDKPGTKPSCQDLSPAEIDMPITDYFETNEGFHLMPDKMNYYQYFCGNYPHCKVPHHMPGVTGNDPRLVRQAYSKIYSSIKRNILTQYFVIGVMEKFEESLKLFSYVLPEIFGNHAEKIAKNTFLNRIHRKSIQSRALFSRPSSSDASQNGTELKTSSLISNKLRQKLRDNQFSYDYDLYKFIYAKFVIQFQDMLVRKQAAQQADSNPEAFLHSLKGL